MSTSSRRLLHTTRALRARVHDRQNHYDILQIPKTSSKREIKNRFYELSKKAHPDVVGGNRAQFEKLTEAYSVLGDDAKRRQYDLSLQPRSTFSPGPGPSSTYSPHSPYLRHNRSSTGPHRAWANSNSSPYGQASTQGRPQGPWQDHMFGERTGGAAGRRYGVPPQFGSSSHHPNLGRYPFGGRESTARGGFGSGPGQAGGNGSGGGLQEDEIKKGGIARFFGVLGLLMTVIGLGGGFNARAEEKTQQEKARRLEESWRSDEMSSTEWSRRTTGGEKQREDP